MENELDILKKLYRSTFQENELIEIYFQYRNSYRVTVSLLQQPRFPDKYALNIIPKVFPIDLLKISKNKRTNPNIRKRAELEFVAKYNRYPLGEKISYMKIAPNSLIYYFIEESDERILLTILENPNLTEEIILKFINRSSPRFTFYEALSRSEWYKRPQIADAISNDPTAPIKIILMIIPYLNLRQLERLFQDPDTHQVVKNNILEYLKERS